MFAQQLACKLSLSLSSQKRFTMPPKKKKMKNPAYVNWRLCPAKWVIITDLEDGMLPLDRELCSPEDAWKVYEEARLPEFEGVCFQQFKERLADHRRAVKVARSTPQTT